jgi:GntR family transcriptional regulator/MocR family aminotransferase
MTLSIPLDPADPSPVYLRIANHLRDAIANGTLRPGARLPSARGLAAELRVARGTVDAAYAVLAGEGAILGRRGAVGTIVSTQVTAPLAELAQPEMRFPARVEAPAGATPLSLGLPALDAFPRKSWAAALNRAARAPGFMGYPDPAGLAELRAAIAGYLGLSRGVKCAAEHIVITQGFQGALRVVQTALLRPGDAVWVEDPGYPPARQALESAGARLVPVRVDAQGMRVAAGVAAAPRARLALLTPAHQSPLGVSLSLPRRLELLNWAMNSGAWVLEDDYDGEFHYVGRPLPSLKSLDRSRRVIYAGSFSKTMFPALRLGFLVVPDEPREAILRASRLGHAGLPALEQRALADFIVRGHYARHLRRMRALYAQRREALANALTARAAGRFVVESGAGGLHLLLRLSAGDDSALAGRARTAGLAVAALSSLALAHNAGSGLLVGFTNIPADQAPAMAGRLAALLAAG